MRLASLEKCVSVGLSIDLSVRACFFQNCQNLRFYSIRTQSASAPASRNLWPMAYPASSYLSFHFLRPFQLNFFWVRFQCQIIFWNFCEIVLISWKLCKNCKKKSLTSKPLKTRQLLLLNLFIKNINRYLHLINNKEMMFQMVRFYSCFCVNHDWIKESCLQYEHFRNGLTWVLMMKSLICCYKTTCFNDMVLWCYGAMVLWCYGDMVIWWTLHIWMQINDKTSHQCLIQQTVFKQFIVQNYSWALL